MVSMTVPRILRSNRGMVEVGGDCDDDNPDVNPGRLSFVMVQTTTAMVKSMARPRSIWSLVPR